jgi:hypothetical protein
MKKLLTGLTLAVLLSHVVLAADDDPDAVYSTLQKAVDDKKPAAEIKPLAISVIKLTAKVTGDAEATKHAQEMGKYAEYQLYTLGIAGPAATTVEMIGALEDADPKSEYLTGAYPTYLAALGGAKAGPAAEKALTNFPDDIYLLSLAASDALGKQQNDRALGYARRALASKAKVPDGMNAATVMGSMHYIAGAVYGSKNQFFECNRELRAALPSLAGDNNRLSVAYYFLGYSNYQLGRTGLNKNQMLEGQKFADQGAAINGPFKSQAYALSQTIKVDVARK